MFRNQRLYEHLKAAVRAASDLIFNISKDGEFSDVITIDGDEDYDPKPSLTDLIDSLRKESSFVSCVRYLMEDSTVERLNSLGPEERMKEIKLVLLQHIQKYLGSTFYPKELCSDKIIVGADSFRQFNEQLFNDYYAEYEKFLYSNSPLRYCISAALENFDYLPNSAIVLDSDIRVVPKGSTFYASYSDCPESQENGDVATTPQITGYNPPKFFLEIDHEMEKVKVPSQCKEHIEFVARGKVREVLKILRLYKEGDLTSGLVCWFPKTPCDPPYSDNFLLYFQGNYPTQDKYYLQEDEVEGLQRLLQKYSSISDKNADNAYSAVYYFNDASKKGEPGDKRDKLVKFISALEALLVPGKDRVSLADRVASFLSESSQKSEEIRKDIKRAYEIRSDIVHGRLKKVDELECEEYAKKIERYARQAIILWLDKTKKGYKA